MRILIFSRVPPDPSHGGSGFYLTDLVAYLAKEGESVSVLWPELPFELLSKGYLKANWADSPNFRLYVPGCFRFSKYLIRPQSFIDATKARVLHALKTAAPWLARLRKRRPLPAAESPQAEPPRTEAVSWNYTCTPQEAASLAGVYARCQPDVLMVNYPWLLTGLDEIGLKSSTHVCTLAHDFRPRDCRLDDSGYHTGITDPEAIAQERKWLSRSHSIVGVQDGEAALFREILPERTVLVARQSLQMRGNDRDPGNPVCGFVGSGNDTNANAAKWFINRVLPLVREKLPDVTFQIAGRVCSFLESFAGTPGVVLRGQVESLDAFYAESSVVVVPLLRGSGIKIKLLEAVSHQRPVVTTSVGLDGLEFLREGVELADTPEAFAQALEELLRDPARRKRQTAASRKVIESTLTSAACYGPLLTHLRASVAKSLDGGNKGAPSPVAYSEAAASSGSA